MHAVVALSAACSPMPEKLTLQLKSVSVVVTAEFHNPSILNPDFLVSRQIVPAGWTVSETLTTPPFSVVKYDNGVEWSVDQSRLTVSEQAGPAFDSPCRVHSLATEYLTKLPHVPYRDLGLNCRVSMKVLDAHSWLLKRFAPPWLQGEHIVRKLSPKFVLDAGDAECHCSLVDGMQNSDGYVIADCNVHHQGLQDMKSLCAAIARWPERQGWINQALDSLMVKDVSA